jgi:glycosyltransferase involved in cell wall biosynthesis
MIIGMMLVKNEANKFLEKTLDQVSKVCDKIIIMDDNSDDETVEICSKYTDLIYCEDKLSFENNESSIREKLFRLTIKECDFNKDWILCLDADEVLTDDSIEIFSDQIREAEKNNCNAIGFKLFDMWNDAQYRDDSLWTAHNRMWIMCMKYNEQLSEGEWLNQKLHCGRFPQVSGINCYFDRENSLEIKHMGWSTSQNRKRKYDRYIRNWALNGLGDLNQYGSILDDSPNLSNFERKILVCAPIREDIEIFNLYLDSLEKLVVPKRAILEYHFILHNSENLIKICEDRGYNYTVFNSENKFDKNEDRHHWHASNVNDVIAMKNGLAEYALSHNFDYVFMVDSDVMVHPQTLSSLIKEEKNIIAEIFWTDWENNGVLLPNCWYWDSYGFTMEACDQWKNSGVYPVGMTGACILIKTDVYKNCNYDRIYNISFDGEDRFFCIRAACNNIEIYVDTKYPATHLYRQSDKEKYIKSLTMRGEQVNG